MKLRIDKNLALPKNQDQNWAKQIKHMRSKANASQRDIAHALGCAVETISRWESGRYMPDVRNQILLKQLEVKIKKSLAGEPEQNQSES